MAAQDDGAVDETQEDIDVHAEPLDTVSSPTDSVFETIRHLIDEAKATATSEVALAQACGKLAYFSLKRLTVWVTIALSCALVGLLAFAIAAVIALVQWTGEPWTALIVPGVLFLIAAITGWRALHNARVLKNVAKSYQQDHRISALSEDPS